MRKDGEDPIFLLENRKAHGNSRVKTAKGSLDKRRYEYSYGSVCIKAILNLMKSCERRNSKCKRFVNQTNGLSLVSLWR